MIESSLSHEAQMCQEWPKLIPKPITLSCVSNYHNGTSKCFSNTCYVSFRSCYNMNISDVDIFMDRNINLPLNLQILYSNYLFHDGYIPFHSAFPDKFELRDDMKSLLLDQKWHRHIWIWKKIVIHVCDECKSSLEKRAIPKFSLANLLYHSNLPEEFCDLTWVEEMACALYWMMAVVTRLFGSQDPNSPQYFKGNTCAHDVNILSTVDILPRTPADINDCISIDFIGQWHVLKHALTPFIIRKKKYGIS